MLVRAWRMWRAKTRLLAPVRTLLPGDFIAPDLRFPELAAGPGRTEHPPYEGLAGVWHDYARRRMADYPAFLAGLARSRKLPLRSVLDLACGAGTLTERLAVLAPAVVGLDASERMLDQARSRCKHIPGVEFVHGDFRDVRLGRRFDAVTCASNSLNYVRDEGELAAVFRGVSDHLHPGGILVFDVITEYGMRLLSGHHYHATVGGARLALRFEYDAAGRRET